MPAECPKTAWPAEICGINSARPMISEPLLAHGIVAHRTALEHLDAHDVDRILIRVNVSAELHVMSLMALEFFRVHHVPALAVLVDERVLVAVCLDGALQRHQRSLRGALISLSLRHGAALL